MKINIIGTDWQKEIADSFLGTIYRFLCLMGGRRGGKSVSFRISFVLAAMMYAATRYWYITPVYAQCKEQFDEVCSNKAASAHILKTRLQPYPLITFRNGSSIGFRSFDRPRALRGSGLDGVWIDEIQDINGDDFWHVVRPLISDKRGKIVVSGQHRGVNSWYYKDFYMPGVEGKRGYKAWNIPTSRGLAFQSKAGREELETVKEQIPKLIWDVEYDCIPTESLTAVFRTEDISKITKGETISRGVDGHKYILGLDLGLIVDHTATTVIDADSGAFVFEKKFPLHSKHKNIAPHIADIAKRFNSATIVYDSTGAGGAATGKKREPYITEYRNICDNMHAVHWNYETKKTLVHEFALAIEQEKLSIPESLKELHKEISLYEFTYKEGGKYEYAAPKGEHDDLLASAMMAWFGKVKGWVPSGKGSPLSYVM